jgi:hypothetical protein
MWWSKYLIDPITNENVTAGWSEKSCKTFKSPELRCSCCNVLQELYIAMSSPWPWSLQFGDGEYGTPWDGMWRIREHIYFKIESCVS